MGRDGNASDNTLLSDKFGSLNPSSVGRFVELNQCPQFFKYQFQDEEPGASHERTDFTHSFTSSGATFQYYGERFEQSLASFYQNETDVVVVDKNERNREYSSENIDSQGEAERIVTLAEELQSEEIEGPLALSQVKTRGVIGEWRISGDCDLLFIWCDSGGTVHFRVGELKSGFEEKTSHRVQAGIYAELTRKALESASVEFDYDVDATVITRDDPVEAHPRDFDTFTLAPILEDVQNLVGKNGRFTQFAYEKSDDVRYKLDSKCKSCNFKEVCYAESVEQASTALLGLSRDEQEVLAEEGVETIHDVAELAEEVPDTERYPGNQSNMENRVTQGSYDTVHTTIATELEGVDPAELIEEAQVMLTAFEESDFGSFGPADRHGHDEDIAWQTGSGYGNLPEHTDGLTRVFINIVRDHRYDRVALASAYVVVPHGENFSVSEVIDTIPSTDDARLEVLADEKEKYTATEKELITEFSEGILDGLREAFAGESGNVHFYLFSDEQENELTNVLDRHDDESANRAFRHLIGQRGCILGDEEQDMLSLIKPELGGRLNSTYPTVTYVPLHDKVIGDTGRVEWENSAAGDEISLRETFEFNCFDYNYQFDYLEQGEGIELDVPSEPPERQTDGYLIPVSGGQIPLQYIWSAVGELDIEWIQKRLESGEITPETVPNLFGYIYRGVGKEDVMALHEKFDAAMNGNVDEDQLTRLNRLNDPRFDSSRVISKSLSDIVGWLSEERGCSVETITREEVSLLGEQFARALSDIEEEIDRRQKDVEKFPIRIPDDDPDYGEDLSVSQAVLDYLALEYDASRKEKFEYYWQTPYQRLRSGKSILGEVTDVTEVDGRLNVDVKLPYDDLQRFEDPDYTKKKIRQKAAEGDGSGAWLIANKVQPENDLQQIPHNEIADIDQRGARRASYIKNGTTATLEKIDLEEGTASITLMTYSRGNDSPFNVWHRPAEFTDSPTRESSLTVTEGDRLILDPSYDDITATRQSVMLNGTENTLSSFLTDVVNDNPVNWVDTEFDSKEAQKFIEFLNERIESDEYDAQEPPYAAQGEFIKETDHKISLLQGPPGTGKTHTLAGTLLSRTLSADKSLTGGFVAPSNTAVDTVMEKTAELLQYTDDVVEKTDTIPSSVADTIIVRVVSQSFDPREADTSLPIVYVDTSMEIREVGDLPDSGAVESDLVGEEIPRRLTEETPNKHIICFGTSSTLSEIIGLCGSGDVTAQSLFNLVGVDEASMLQLPGLFVPGSVMTDRAQLLVAGDQRQMPPVRKHDWESEYRKNIQQLAPHLSVLNFFRLLRGETISEREIVGTDLDKIAFETGQDISLTQLNLTYRCDETLTGILSNELYQKWDNLRYETAAEAPELDDDTQLATHTGRLNDTFVDEVLSVDSPVILVTHDESSSKQLNEIEAKITCGIVEAIDGGTDDDKRNLGVVTPHNSQRSRIQTATRNEDWVTTDTVERFQGGEKDAIVVSATESDPDYLSQNSEFILSPNRINVALSRMKHKLVVVASEEIFNIVPNDVEQYEDAELWKGLLTAADENELWSGTTHELLDDPDVLSASVSVRELRPDK